MFCVMMFLNRTFVLIGGHIMKLLTITLCSIFLWFMAPSTISNAYLQGNTFTTIEVRQGDDLWNIAKRYSSEKDDIRDLVFAIIELNHLDRNAHIFPGQTIKIPLIK